MAIKEDPNTLQICSGTDGDDPARLLSRAVRYQHEYRHSCGSQITETVKYYHLHGAAFATLDSAPGRTRTRTISVTGTQFFGRNLLNRANNSKPEFRGDLVSFRNLQFLRHHRRERRNFTFRWGS